MCALPQSLYTTYLSVYTVRSSSIRSPPGVVCDYDIPSTTSCPAPPRTRTVRGPWILASCAVRAATSSRQRSFSRDLGGLALLVDGGGADGGERDGDLGVRRKRVGGETRAEREVEAEDDRADDG